MDTKLQSELHTILGEFKVLSECYINHPGWAQDDKAWLIQSKEQFRDTNFHIVTTNHGKLEFLSREDLDDFIQAEQRAINSKKELLELLNNSEKTYHTVF